jgi:hypothetical protein
VQFRKAFAVALLLVGAAYAQTPDELRSKIAGVKYLPLAQAARVQGDVHLSVNGGEVLVVSGPELLVQTAVQSTRAIGPIQGETNLDVTYHFVLVDTTLSVPVATTVKRGNAFERAVLRMFGVKTEKVVIENQCQQQALPPPNAFKVSGAVVEIWIYGRSFCLQTQSAALLARR